MVEARFHQTQAKYIPVRTCTMVYQTERLGDMVRFRMDLVNSYTLGAGDADSQAIGFKDSAD